MSQSPKKFDYTKWSFVLGIPIALVGVIATAVTVPEIRCNIGWISNGCVAPLQTVELVTQTETGESLAGVKIQFIAKGAPEIENTDNNGYAKVQIPSQGDVRVILSKAGYPTQDFTINLANEQNTVRIIRFNQSGQPEVQPAQSLPAPKPVFSPSPAPSPELTSPRSPENGRYEVFIPNDVERMWVYYQNKSLQNPSGCERASDSKGFLPKDFKTRINEFIDNAQRTDRSLIITAFSPSRRENENGYGVAGEIRINDQRLTPMSPYWCNGDMYYGYEYKFGIE
ncbi:hypothetical protein [Lyngbya aestuarii]|uniref:hypothetical protein n=1 Tax=Lyngbya aestuarii TaxID=118322 RepID=UPI00403D6C35